MNVLEWIKFNYDISVGSSIVFKKQNLEVKNIKVADNVGHFRTSYPAVVGIHDEDSKLPEKIQWLTIEEIFGF